MNAWDRPETPFFYEEFCERFDRYRRANKVLVTKARLKPSLRRVLDFGAGTGRTAEAALTFLGPNTDVICMEPSPTMRERGQSRLSDPRIRWVDKMPDESGAFERILCGAMIWQLNPLADSLIALSRLLCKGGCLCFNIPALYLNEPDEPGSGEDPYLFTLPSLIRKDHVSPEGSTVTMTAALIEEWLRAAGLRSTSWTHRMRISQEEYAAWFKIPVLTERLCGSLTPMQRAKWIDESLKALDLGSWKWERWKGWTAWK